MTTIKGNLGRDPEFRFTKAGVPASSTAKPPPTSGPPWSAASAPNTPE